MTATASWWSPLPKLVTNWLLLFIILYQLFDSNCIVTITIAKIIQAGAASSKGGRSWQAFGEKKCLKFFRRECICWFTTNKWCFVRITKIWTFRLTLDSFVWIWTKGRCNKIAHVRASNFHPSPNFLAKALLAFAQLLPPWIYLVLKPISMG